MTNLTIGEVARKAGLQTSAIRYYEKIGLLPKTQRIGGQRRYETSVLNYLEIIDVAKRAGFRMDEISTFSTDSAEGSRHSTAGRYSRNAR
jgi:MerR family transcriptional regulator, redox-sensitive transcriptional activator SoxR